MKRLAILLVATAVLWSGWWFFALRGMEIAVRSWLDERRALGWQAEVLQIERSGYPLHLKIMLNDLALADPQRGIAFGLDRLGIAAAAWWPFRASLDFPKTPISIASPDGRAEIVATEASAIMDLHPGTSLELAHMALTSGPWALSDASGLLLSAEDFILSMTQDPESREAYALEGRAATLSPGPAVRQLLRVPDSWPRNFETLIFQMDVIFDRPWDLAAIEGLRPQPRRIDLRLAEAAWGAAVLRATADLTVSDAGVPEGSVSLQARNWREMLDLAEASGRLAAGLRPQVERVLSALANASGNPDAIDITVSVSNELISLGFIPLAPAPRLVLR